MTSDPKVPMIECTEMAAGLLSTQKYNWGWFGFKFYSRFTTYTSVDKKTNHTSSLVSTANRKYETT